MDTPTGQLLYLYCVTDGAPAFTNGRAGPDRPHVIRHEGLYAVVDKVSRAEFDEENLKRNLTDLEWVKRRVIMHEHVLETVMMGSGMVPFKFATLFTGEDNLRGMIAQNAHLLKEALRNVAGHEEWGLKIYCDTDALRTFLRQDREGPAAAEETGSSSPGKAFIRRKQQEARLAHLLSKTIGDCGQADFNELRGLCSRARINRLLPKEATPRAEDMILNAAFLIRKTKVQAFLETVARLRAQQADRGLFFDCTGPWPPYNFCDAAEKAADHARP